MTRLLAWLARRWAPGLFLASCATSGTVPAPPDPPYDAAAWHQATLPSGWDAAVPAR